MFASELKPYKAIGDQLIYTPAKFKKLFGTTADISLQGTFKVVKAQGATITDNEIIEVNIWYTVMCTISHNNEIYNTIYI